MTRISKIILISFSIFLISCSSDEDGLNSIFDGFGDSCEATNFDPSGYTFSLSSSTMYDSQIGFEDSFDSGECSGNIVTEGNAGSSNYDGSVLTFYQDSIHVEEYGNINTYYYDWCGDTLDLGLSADGTSGSFITDFVFTSNTSMLLHDEQSCSGSGIYSWDDYTEQSCADSSGTWCNCTTELYEGVLTETQD